MSFGVRVSVAVGLTIALALLAPGGLSFADDSDEVGSYGSTKPVPHKAQPPASTPQADAKSNDRWAPRLRRALGFDKDDDRQNSLPAAETTRPADRPSGSPSPVPTLTPSSSQRSPAATTAAGSNRTETSPAETEELPELVILPQPSADDKPAPSGYTRSIGEAIAHFNRHSRSAGKLRIYAREGSWGPAVKLQDCFGDNILTKFAVSERGLTQRLWFQFRDATYRKGRWHWIMVDPGMIIRGRKIYLRAQSSSGSDIVTLQVVGNCIDP